MLTFPLIDSLVRQGFSLYLVYSYRIALHESFELIVYTRAFADSFLLCVVGTERNTSQAKHVVDKRVY